MNRPWQRFVALIGLGAAASQAGHLVVYQLRYGSAALTVQSQGAHAYFPAFAMTSLGLIAFMLVGAVLIVGVSRLLTVRPGVRSAPGPSYFNLLTALFTVQLACFVLQESVEAALAGATLPSAAHLVLFGSVGQIPVALVAALALKWLFIRFEAALDALRQAFPVEIPVRETFAVLLGRRTPFVQLALAEACPAAFVKRGPPRTLRS
jgi:hypothetical protein